MKNVTRMTPSQRRAAKVVGTAAVIAVMLVTLRDKLPAPDQVLVALHTADIHWLLVAGLAEFASMSTFARQQRRLLLAFGVSMPRHRALALSYSRSAISISLPAGSAVSAGYAFRQFRAGGATRASATAVMVLSGVLSFAGLALLYATGALTVVWQTHPVIVSVGAVAALGILGWLANRLTHQEQHEPRPHTGKLAPVLDALATARDVAPRHWALALGAAVVNWMTDLLCLYASARAFGLTLGLVPIAGVYLTVQILRQIPLTPGGIGVIEVGLLTGLVSAGAAEPAAAAAVLSYRLLSCWLVLPLGLLGWFVLRKEKQSDLVDAALLDEAGLGEDGERLREDGLPIGPGRDMGQEQPAGTGVTRQLTRLLPRKVDARRALRRVGPRRLREQHVDVAGELGERGTRPGVTGVSERTAAVAHADAESRGRMVDRDRDDLERPDHDGLGAERVEGVDVRQIRRRPFGLVRGERVRQPRRRVRRGVHRQQPRARRVRRLGVVAAQDGQRAEVGAVVGMQMGQHQRIESERIADGLELGQRAVPEFEPEHEALGLEQVAGRGGIGPGDTARATEDGQSHPDTLCAGSRY
jgi:uncharacterized membrane protein YbhN (UPF0104 family)